MQDTPCMKHQEDDSVLMCFHICVTSERAPPLYEHQPLQE